MTDQELTRVIAEKVMGWSTGRWYRDPDEWCYDGAAGHPFSPLTSDADCMAAWDKFMQDYIPKMSKDEANRLAASISEWMFNYAGEKRRRAMVTFIAKAVVSE